MVRAEIGQEGKLCHRIWCYRCLIFHGIENNLCTGIKTRGTFMFDKTPTLCRHLNILGFSTILLAFVFLFVFFHIDNDQEGLYFLGAMFTCLVLVILSFGFSKIIEILYQILQKDD